MLTVGSLFAGFGGLDLGLQRCGCEIRWQVEIEDYARAVLERHFPGAARFTDVLHFPPADFGALAVDLICGGFPCQDLSVAGKGAGLQGEKSGLFYELIRILQQLQPRFALIENVTALLSRGMGEVLGRLAEIGYDAEWHCIPAVYTGAHHFRDRLFIVASSRSQGPLPKLELPARGTLAGSWEPEPEIQRMAYGIPNRSHRLRGLGNAVLPQVGELITRAIIKALPAAGGPGSDSVSKSARKLATWRADEYDWRTDQRCLLEGWQAFQASWPRSGIMRDGVAWRLPTQYPGYPEWSRQNEKTILPTPNASDGSRGPESKATKQKRGSGGVNLVTAAALWPTPTRSDSAGGGFYGNGSPKLQGAVSLYPTPLASDAKGLKSLYKNTLSLRGYVELFPTPRSRDFKDSGSVPHSRQADPGKDTLGQRVAREGSGGPLNPEWVEWLMGFPGGWSEVAAG